jgi:hypothetical protein
MCYALCGLRIKHMEAGGRTATIYWSSTIPLDVISTAAFGLPLEVPTASMALTTSMPSTTSPNTTCLPSSQLVTTVVMKN